MSLIQMHHTLNGPGPLNCLTINKEASRVVVGGHNLFKLFSIDEDHFDEVLNIRLHTKHTGLRASPSVDLSIKDVTWNRVDENIIASAGTNGAIILWNLGKSTQFKQDYICKEHKRTVSRVNFNPCDSNLLLSGSHDGFIKLFDLRTRSVVGVYGRSDDCVRDVQFPQSADVKTFASAYDNGNVALWDLRCPEKRLNLFAAHSQPIFCLSWHPEQTNTLATAGRDKQIRVWDLQSLQDTKKAKPKLIHVIQTMDAISQIKWRPQYPYHIASSSLIFDKSVNIWDIRRPFIPFVAFNEHTDVATGISWKLDEADTFFSTGKDNKLYQHHFSNATHPISMANLVTSDISVHGHLGFASCEKMDVKNSSSSTLQQLFNRQPDKVERFNNKMSNLLTIELADDSLSMEWFMQSAQKYKLFGAPLEELCEHNADVAEKLDRSQVAATWRLIRSLYSSMPTALESNFGRACRKGDSSDSAENKIDQEKRFDSLTGLSDDEWDTDTHLPFNVLHRHSEDFMDGDTTIYAQASSHSINEKWILPLEGFSKRQEIMQLEDDGSEAIQVSPMNQKENLLTSMLGYNVHREFLFLPCFQKDLPPWNFHDVVIGMLENYAEMGDIQTTVSIIIVLGKCIEDHLSSSKVEPWFLFYIELLSRFRLWVIANEVIRSSTIPAIYSLNQNHTVCHTNCARCSKPLNDVPWLCNNKCHGFIHTCAICHLPVKGLYLWCQGCSHGGHLHHMRQWLQKNDHCPTGCGHFCQFA